MYAPPHIDCNCETCESRRRIAELEAENTKLWKLVINVDYLMAQGYTDSFSNWVCPSELVLHLKQTLAALLKEKGDE